MTELLKYKPASDWVYFDCGTYKEYIVKLEIPMHMHFPTSIREKKEYIALESKSMLHPYFFIFYTNRDKPKVFGD